MNQIRFDSSKQKNVPTCDANTYAGSIDVMVCPDLDFTNSLLMNRPVGCVYLTPLGAVSSIDEALMIDTVMRDLIQYCLVLSCLVLQWMRSEMVI